LDAIKRNKDNTKFYLNLLEMQYSGDLKENEEKIPKFFDKAILASSLIKMRITFSQREVEFLKDLDQMLINF
jgi:pre-mRNA-processing factor 39